MTELVLDIPLLSAAACAGGKRAASGGSWPGLRIGRIIIAGVGTLSYTGVHRVRLGCAVVGSGDCWFITNIRPVLANNLQDLWASILHQLLNSDPVLLKMAGKAAAHKR